MDINGDKLGNILLITRNIINEENTPNSQYSGRVAKNLHSLTISLNSGFNEGFYTIKIDLHSQAQTKHLQGFPLFPFEQSVTFVPSFLMFVNTQQNIKEEDRYERKCDGYAKIVPNLGAAKTASIFWILCIQSFYYIA